VREVSDMYSEFEASHRLVDRAIVELRSGEAAPKRVSAEVAMNLRDCMRDELFGLMAHLHFCEISTRELDYAAERIAEMRRWMDCLDCGSVELPG
jgi:hypothetical protein